MPELPEVETIASDLGRNISGEIVSSIELLSPGSVKNTPILFKKKLIGKSIESVSRRGKLLIFKLKDDFLLIHLKMTGQLIYTDKKIRLAGGHSLKDGSYLESLGGELPNKHTRVIINFKNGAKLFFNDLRKFGYLKIVKSEELTIILKNNYGPEPLTPDFTIEYLKKLFVNRKIKIKALLLDQKKIAGLGNIYVDEVLFASKIRPDRLASSLKPSEIKKLFLETNILIRKAIENRGTTFSNYVDSRGKKGNFSQYLKVYGRKGGDCLTCKNPIIRTKIAGRGTHYCANCQK